MTGTNEGAPEFKDRTVGLVVFGAVSVLIGIACALLVPLTFLSVALSESAGEGVYLRSAWAASAMYGVMAISFVWLGVGSIRARRWACELLLSLSWIWLLTGICSLIVGLLIVPSAVRQLGGASDLSPEVETLVIFVTFAVIGVLYVVLPGLFVLFYRSPHVAATCRSRFPEPQWIDDLPRRLLTLTVVWVLLAISVLLAPAYSFFFPLFGIVLTGAAGAGLWALVLACCIALAVGTCRRAHWAWTGGVALTLAATLSSILTVLRFDLMEIAVLMELPEDQRAMIDALPMLDGWVMVLANIIAWGTFLVYLMTLKSYFVPESIEVDG
jgi:hypothetical protein